jgi:hypothetical protein
MAVMMFPPRVAIRARSRPGFSQRLAKLNARSANESSGALKGDGANGRNRNGENGVVLIRVNA